MGQRWLWPFEQHRRGETSNKDSSPLREDWWTGLFRTCLIAGSSMITGFTAVWMLECPSDGSPFIIACDDQDYTKAFIGFWILKVWLAVLSHCHLQSVTENSWKEVPTLLNSLRETHPCLAFRFYSDWDCNPMIQCFQDAKFIAGRTNMLVQLAAFLQESIASHAWPNVALPQHCNVYLNTQKQFVFVHFLTL